VAPGLASASIDGEANPYDEVGKIPATGRPSAVSKRPELDSSAGRPLLELPAHASSGPPMRMPCVGGPDGGLPTSPAGGGAQGRQHTPSPGVAHAGAECCDGIDTMEVVMAAGCGTPGAGSCAPPPRDGG
jgi:hypothetical protein